MSLEQLYYVSQITAVILILGSLIAIFLQQRQTNEIVRADVTHKAIAQTTMALKEIMTNPSLAKAFRKVMFEREELTPVETTQMSTYFNLTINNYRNAYRSVKTNMIDASYIQDAEHNIAWFLTAPEFIREWGRIQRQGHYGQDFADHVNRFSSEINPDHGASVAKRSTSPDA
jgi:hypothetical protein